MKRSALALGASALALALTAGPANALPGANQTVNGSALTVQVGPVGVNAPIVAFLYGPVAPAGGRVDGVISQGTITAANLIGPLAGHPLADLITAMNAGNTYVNAHTNDGVGLANTGPGDFPGGEVRGQIR